MLVDSTSLFERRRFAIKPGLERVKALLERLGSPERNLTAVHIVGTNGKGSTAAMLASITSRAGYRTGLFTSPHLIHFRERFRINGSEIDQERLERLTAQVVALADEESTFFEITTAMALRYFADEAADVVILEAGMGGEHDATAVAQGPLTLVTPIDFDHCQWLGKDLATITETKLRIARSGSIVLSTPQQPDVARVIQEQCQKHHIRYRSVATDLQQGALVYRGSDGDPVQVTVPLAGRHQMTNAALAVAAAQMLSSCGIPIRDSAIVDGIAAVQWPGRLQFQSYQGANLILDGAHNPAGIATLVAWLQEQTFPQPPLLLCGVMDDKDMTELPTRLAPLVSEVCTVTINQERAMSAAVLARQFTEAGCHTIAAPSLQEGLKQLLGDNGQGKTIIITGSLYLVGEALALTQGVDCHAVRG